MRKQILVALALFPVVAYAEITPGTLEVSGNSSLGFNAGTIDVKSGQSTDTTDFGFAANGLYYLTPNIGLGVTVDYSNSTTKSAGVEHGLSTLLFGPAVAVDYPVAQQLSLFGRGMFGYASSKYTETGSPDVTPSGFGFGLEAGVKYFPVKNFSLDAGIGYDWVRLKEDPVEVTNSGFGVNVGLSVYFGGK